MSKLLSAVAMAVALVAIGSMPMRAQDSDEEPGVRDAAFVPKGQWVTGISVSYSQSNQKNYQFLVLEDISAQTYTFRVTPMVCFIFRDNMGAGGKFGYSRSLTKLDRANVVLDSETGYEAEQLYSLAHNYYGMAILRNYFPLGDSRRFGIFTEAQLRFGGGQSKLTRGGGAETIGAYERNLSFDVGLAPGLVAFLTNYSALEVNVGVLGFSYTHTHQISNQIYVSNRKARSANFRINLFSISFGVVFYL